MKKLMRRLRWKTTIPIMCVLLPASAVYAEAPAQMQTVVADGSYEMSLDESLGESLKTAKIRARLEALRAASEQAGVYVAASSAVQDGVLTQDDVRMISSTVLRVQEETYTTKAVGGKSLRVTCRLRAGVTATAIDRALIERDKDAQRWRLLSEQNRALAKELAHVQEENAQIRAAYAQAQTPEERKRLAAQAIQNQQAVEALDFVTRGNAYLDLEEYDDAVEAYSEAIRLNPDLLIAYNNRGVAYLSNPWNLFTDQAIEDFSIVLRKEPDAIETLKSRAFAYLKSGAAVAVIGNPPAIWDFDEVIRRRPGDASAYNGRGYAYHQMGRKQQALADYTKAIEHAPETAAYYVNRAQLFYELEDYASSYQDAVRAKALVGTLQPLRHIEDWTPAYMKKETQQKNIDALLRDLARRGYH